MTKDRPAVVSTDIDWSGLPDPGALAWFERPDYRDVAARIARFGPMRPREQLYAGLAALTTQDAAWWKFVLGTNAVRFVERHVEEPATQRRRLVQSTELLPKNPPRNANWGQFYDLAVDTPQEAWEKFVSDGLVAANWLDDPDRVFNDIVPRTNLTVSTTERFPPTFMTCCQVAGAFAAMLEVEALAREAVERLRPYSGNARPRRIAWLFAGVRLAHNTGYAFLKDEYASTGHLFRGLPAVRGGAADAFRQLYGDAARFYDSDEFRWNLYRATWIRRLTWAEDCARLAAHREVEELARLPNPYEPLNEIHERGFAVASLNDDQLTLLYPTDA